jgi:alpha-N-arabinofuranosidase
MLQFAADPGLTTRSTSWYVWEVSRKDRVEKREMDRKPRGGERGELTLRGQLMAAHPITRTLSASADFGPLYYVAGMNEKTQGHIFKAAVYNSTKGADVPVRLTFEGVVPGTTAELTVLTGPENPYGVNDPHTGINVVKTSKTTIKSDKKGTFAFSLPNLSVAVLDTTTKRRGARQRW